MMPVVTKFFLLLFLIVGLVKGQQKTVPLIPQPNKISFTEGSFLLTTETRLVVQTKSLINEVNLFNDYLKQYFGFSLPVLVGEAAGANYITLIENNADNQGAEKYELECRKNIIRISSKKDGPGFLYGLFDILQIIGATKNINIKTGVAIPSMDITNEPRFKWRGMHLDVCRHFYPKEFIKRYIDLLVQYKFNTFHWHLTEDQGWRIEIKKYPLLTSVGAWRKGSMLGKYSAKKFDSIPYGGFYTQEDISEIVSYASARHINIVPEIEMPGHSVAAIAAYPFLSCHGKKINVAKSWGVFDDVYCPKDSTFQFLEDVLTEVMELFPGKYIHIGGDECPKENWKKCKNCQTLITKENLKNEHELQSYFIKRIEKFVNSKGKQIIGWDEILEGGLAPNAAVMSWRGTQGGIEAAKQKHQVVMSPGKPCYFDHYQSKNTSKEPLAIGGYNPLDSVYAYDPTPKVLSEHEREYILGAQANVWTEYILNEKQVEYMAVPRMCALAEVLWTNSENRNFKSFIQRLKLHCNLLDTEKVNYAKHFLKQP